MPLSLPASLVDQTQQREREDSRRWWPGFLIGYLPDDLERLRKPDPKAVKYPLQEEG